MAATRNANLVNENSTTKALELVDEVIYISDDEVEDLTSDTAEKDEISMDETVSRG